MDHKASTVRILLLILGGPLIWAVHFSIMYGAVTLLCKSASVDNSARFLIFATLGTLIAIAALLTLLARQLIEAGRERTGTDARDGSRFLRRSSVLLAAAALLAVVWSTFPVIMLPACSGAGPKVEIKLTLIAADLSM
jgi:hypothetical protein